MAQEVLSTIAIGPPFINVEPFYKERSGVMGAALIGLGIKLAVTR